MLSNPSSLVLSDQRTKNVLHSLRNCGTQSQFLGLVLWTCFPPSQCSSFVSVTARKHPEEKKTYGRKGFISAPNSRSVIIRESRQELPTASHSICRAQCREKWMHTGWLFGAQLVFCGLRGFKSPCVRMGTPRWGGASQINSLDQYNPRQRVGITTQCGLSLTETFFPGDCRLGRADSWS